MPTNGGARRAGRRAWQQANTAQARRRAQHQTELTAYTASLATSPPATAVLDGPGDGLFIFIDDERWPNPIEDATWLIARTAVRALELLGEHESDHISILSLDFNLGFPHTNIMPVVDYLCRTPFNIETIVLHNTQERHAHRVAMMLTLAGYRTRRAPLPDNHTARTGVDRCRSCGIVGHQIDYDPGDTLGHDVMSMACDNGHKWSY